MTNWIKILYHNEIIRYVFFGGCTTLVNLAVFYVLRRLDIGLNTANVCSIILAILFAYGVNARFVFQQKCRGFRDHFHSFCRFIGARLVTMAVEVGGVWLLVEALHFDDMVGKILTQFLVIVLNYIFSKFFVFHTAKNEGERG